MTKTRDVIKQVQHALFSRHHGRLNIRVSETAPAALSRLELGKHALLSDLHGLLIHCVEMTLNFHKICAMPSSSFCSNGIFQILGVCHWHDFRCYVVSGKMQRTSVINSYQNVLSCQKKERRVLGEVVQKLMSIIIYFHINMYNFSGLTLEAVKIFCGMKPICILAPTHFDIYFAPWGFRTLSTH